MRKERGIFMKKVSIVSLLFLFIAQTTWGQESLPAGVKPFPFPTPQPQVLTKTIPPYTSRRAPTNSQQFCNITSNQLYADILESPYNRLEFLNSGGLFNKGVCWWHSRLARLFTQLAIFQPELPKPTTNIQVDQLLTNLVNYKVTQIPGYSNLSEFSKEWESTFQRFLNRWQVRDGVEHLSWIDGLKGDSKTTPEALWITVYEIYSRIHYNHEIVFAMLQLPGITAHAWLITKATLTDSGVLLRYYDSNSWSLGHYLYRFGDQTFVGPNKSTYFVPYVQKSNEFEAARDAARSFCGL